MLGGPDYIVLKSLDTDGIRLIGSVLGQSIALDYFVSQVGICQMAYLDLYFLQSTHHWSLDRDQMVLSVQILIY